MVVLGRITAPYGIQGWVKVHVFGDDPLALAAMHQWWLGRDPEVQDDWKAVELLDCREQGGAIVVRLDGVGDRNAAEALKGFYVGAPRKALPATEDDEFYWGDLIGLAVVNEQGQALGAVTGLLEAGAHDVLVVRDGDEAVEGKAKERLLPFVASVVRRVDVAGGVILVDWGTDW